MRSSPSSFAAIASDLRPLAASVDTDVPLAGYTTLRVGGPASVLVHCETSEQVVAVLRFLDRGNIPTLVLAGGSNVLIGDDGFAGVVVRIASKDLSIVGGTVTAAAGAVWDDVVQATVAAGLGGLECLSGIPGSAGATPVQNVGAYGVEVASVLSRVELLDRTTGAVAWVPATELGLAYRTSILKGSDRAVVLSVEFELTTDGLSAPVRYGELADRLGVAVGARVPAEVARETVLALRRGKGMVLDPADFDTFSAGSFFTNPIVAEPELPAVLAAITERVGTVPIPQYPADNGTKLSAGWLIERAGFSRGYPGPHAPASLSTKHTLALTNRGSARAADIVALARDVQAGVRTAFGVVLHPEPVTVGVRL